MPGLCKLELLWPLLSHSKYFMKYIFVLIFSCFILKILACAIMYKLSHIQLVKHILQHLQIWMVKIWQIFGQSSISPNFRDAKVSLHTVDCSVA